MKISKARLKEIITEEVQMFNEAKGLASARVSQHGLDSVPPMMAKAGAYEKDPQAMMRLMRTLTQTAQGLDMSPEETLELARQMISADMLTTAETDPTGSLEESDELSDIEVTQD